MVFDESQRDAADEDSSSEHGNELLLNVGANIARAGKRHQRLRDTFSLPVAEQFADAFHCALRDKILIQGRLYVFDSHICFYSNLFGIVTKHQFHVCTIQKMQHATHLLLPNSIEVVLHSGKKYFYTSFLSRDEAYELMNTSWSRCRSSQSSAAGFSNILPEIKQLVVRSVLRAYISCVHCSTAWNTPVDIFQMISL